jgi:hypothetical protein
MANDDLLISAFLDAVERDVRIAFDVAGVHGLLGALNSRTRFRYTAIARLAGGLEIEALYDRDLPSATEQQAEPWLLLAAADVAAELGVVDAVDGNTFDFSNEHRASGHYCVGASLRDEAGRIWGVLYHCDRRPRLAGAYEHRVLDHIGARLRSETDRAPRFARTMKSKIVRADEAEIVRAAGST